MCPEGFARPCSDTCQPWPSSWSPKTNRCLNHHRGRCAHVVTQGSWLAHRARRSFRSFAQQPTSPTPDPRFKGPEGAQGHQQRTQNSFLANYFLTCQLSQGMSQSHNVSCPRPQPYHGREVTGLDSRRATINATPAQLCQFPKSFTVWNVGQAGPVGLFY